MVERRPRPAPPELAPQSLIEGLIEQLVSATPAEIVEAARVAFEERGGAFSTGDAFHEERIRAFSDELVCDVRGVDGRTPAERALAEAIASSAIEPHTMELGTIEPSASPASERVRWLRALTQSERGLYRVEREGLRRSLRCLLGGAVLWVRLDADSRDPSARLRDGDVFDGRIAPLDGAIRVLPGMVFHREEAHEALFAMLPRLLAAGHTRPTILDGLLRMRMRHDRFTSIHARHLYRVDALEMREIQAASWKGRARD